MEPGGEVPGHRHVQAPTAVRVLKKQDPALPHQVRPLQPARPVPGGRAAGRAHRQVDCRRPAGAHHRQLLADRDRLAHPDPDCQRRGAKSTAFGSPGKAVYGYNVQVARRATGEKPTGANQKGVVAIEGPAPVGCMQTVWRDDARFVNTYWKSIPASLVYSTFDWGVRDADGYFFILGRTDDVINVAGHRLGTREIEEAISSIQHCRGGGGGRGRQLKGQVAMAFAVVKNASRLETTRRAPSWRPR